MVPSSNCGKLPEGNFQMRWQDHTIWLNKEWKATQLSPPQISSHFSIWGYSRLHPVASNHARHAQSQPPNDLEIFKLQISYIYSYVPTSISQFLIPWSILIHASVPAPAVPAAISVGPWAQKDAGANGPRPTTAKSSRWCRSKRWSGPTSSTTPPGESCRHGNMLKPDLIDPERWPTHKTIQSKYV